MEILPRLLFFSRHLFVYNTLISSSPAPCLSFVDCSHRQGVLLLLALVSVPVLLLAKPLTIRSRMNKAAARHDSFSSESQLMGGEPTSTGEKIGDGHSAGGDHGGGHEEHDFSEVVIHQVRIRSRRKGKGFAYFFPGGC